MEKLKKTAFANNILIAGSLPESTENNIFNTTYIVDTNGAVIGSYKKIHLFSLMEEEKYFSSGNKIVVCETSIGPIGIMICYDLRFPELCRSLALKGALVVLVSAQWPLVRIDHWNVLLRARAIENQIFIAAANGCGNDDGIKFGGHSQIISPTGNILAMAGADPCLKYAELNLKEISEFRNNIPCFMERAPHVYEI